MLSLFEQLNAFYLRFRIAEDSFDQMLY